MSDSASDSIVPSPAETDALLNAVTEQLDWDIFDSEDRMLLQQMVESLADARPKIRLRLIRAFGDIGEPATPVLIEALSGHPDPVVRRASGQALSLIADPEAVAPLIQALLRDQDPIVHKTVMGALIRIGEAAVPSLQAVLELPEVPDRVRSQVDWVLSRIRV